MENKPTKKPRNNSNKPNVQHIPTITVENDAIDEKISQIISLQNGLSANEKMLDILNEKIKECSKQVTELKAENNKMNFNYNALNYKYKHANEQLSRVPKFIKWLFNIN